MKRAKQARQYAKTLINITGIEDAPAAFVELTVVETLMSKSREFRSLLLNPGFSREEREAAFKKVAERIALSEKIVKFVTHLVEIGVIVALSEIIKAATALYLEKKKRAKATVLTPVEISGKQVERLRTALKRMIEKDVDIEVVSDPSLLGGVLVKVGSTMYDSSIRGQLRLLKDELIKG